jgi:hypothetical protein
MCNVTIDCGDALDLERRSPDYSEVNSYDEYMEYVNVHCRRIDYLRVCESNTKKPYAKFLPKANRRMK